MSTKRKPDVIRGPHYEELCEMQHRIQGIFIKEMQELLQSGLLTNERWRQYRQRVHALSIVVGDKKPEVRQ